MTAMQTALATAPIATSVDASSTIFQSYTTGVITSLQCGTSPSYNVAIVGWGTDPNAGPFWVVKPSLGTSWGMSGFALVGIQESTTDVGVGYCGI